MRFYTAVWRPGVGDFKLQDVRGANGMSSPMLAAEGKIDIMIGPRSALFTPFPKLGLIIIDEEHEGAYQSETAPRYDARETAAVRARMNGASLILGSATPSVESYYRAETGGIPPSSPDKARQGSTAAWPASMWRI